MAVKNKIKSTEPLIFGICLAILLLITGLTLSSKVAMSLLNNKPLLILLIGTDDVDYAKHSDTMILLCYDPATRYLNY
ncbi:MAG: hypothetical protein WC955_11965, partial [Elusimicrobiota bacterium]